MVSQANQALGTANTHQLFVFNALDRVSRDGNWLHVSAAIKALLRLVLELKSFKHLHAKVFLRTDQYKRGRFTDFPDIAKIRATRVELLWSLIDLHALLWQCLWNGPPSAPREAFQTWCIKSSPVSLFGSPDESAAPSSPEARWELPLPVQQDESIQRQLFERLAGLRMGSGARRGVPYTWIVNHLADAQGQATPRSFLTAIRNAAEESIYRFRDAERPLHYEGLKRGVQAASEIRIAELEEDHPWLSELVKPFAERRSLVPFIEETFEDVLNEAFGSIPEDVPGLAERLPKDLRNQGVYGLTTSWLSWAYLLPCKTIASTCPTSIALASSSVGEVASSPLRARLPSQTDRIAMALTPLGQHPTFGNDPAALTANEASYISGFRTADELRNRAAQAAEENDLCLRTKGFQLQARPAPLNREGWP